MTEAVLKRKQYDLGAMLPFVLLHASVLLVLTVPFSAAMGACRNGLLNIPSHRSRQLSR